MPHPVELYGSVTGNSLRAAIALEEAGISYVARRVDLHAGAQRDTAYLAINPAGKVPALVDPNLTPALILNQSNAIVQYADARSPGRLSPVGPPSARLLTMDRYFFFVTDVIAPSHAAFFLRKLQQHDAADVIDFRVIEQIAYSERFLTESFMAGDQFSMADISAFTIAAAVKEKLDWKALPRLSRWFEIIQARPGVQAGLKAFECD